MENNYWLIKEEPTKYSYNDLVNTEYISITAVVISAII